jgi:hypothetical protein
LKPTPPITPARRTARSACTVCSGVPPTGFSQNTCLPASATASTSSTWSMLGAAIHTASTAGSSTTRRQSSVPRAKPNDATASSAAPGAGSAQISSTGS